MCIYIHTNFLSHSMYLNVGLGDGDDLGQNLLDVEIVHQKPLLLRFVQALRPEDALLHRHTLV